EARKSGVPPKTRRQTSWACGVCCALVGKQLLHNEL
ncbi:hypothetical protein GBAR_LOCUS12439, partial [Geodia barretti]